MSSLYVRTLARTWLNGLPTIGFYDTINRVQKPGDLIWCTVEFFALDKSGLLGCDGYKEDGVIDLIFMANPGIGDTELLTALEPAVASFMSNRDPAAKLTLTTDEPLREMSGGDADRYYRIGVGVNYEYST